MAINLSALAPATTTATALSNLVLVSPQATVGFQPQNPPNKDGTQSDIQQPPKFLFNYEGEQSVTIESDITDHYVEDNTAIQDQIALKPEVVSTHGFIGELNDVTPEALQLLKTAANKLTVIGAYTPQLTTTALIAYTEAFLLYQVAANAANAAVSAWSSVANAVTGSDGQSVIGSNGLTSASSQDKQQTAFQKFYGFWRSRTLFTVQTPWAVFQSMAINSLRAVQDPETRVITDFEIKFKMIRTATTKSSVIASSVDGQLKSQAAPLDNGGTSAPVESIGLGDGLATMGVA